MTGNDPQPWFPGVRVALLMLSLVAPSTARAEAAPAFATPTIVSLETNPSTITLRRKHDYVQIVLTAKTATGETFDLTRTVTPIVSSDRDAVRISPTGMIVAQADGQAELCYRFAGHSVRLPVTVSGISDPLDVNFVRDCMPILSKLGCNQGTCHGSQEGKNGFKLSLRGYDPLHDYRALTDDLAARRIEQAMPDESLLLLKPTGRVPHAGGQRLEPNSAHYDLLKTWIAEGATLERSTPRVVSLEMFPKNPVLPRGGMTQQVRVVATYADGLARDVTAEAFVESGNLDVATTDSTGLTTSLRRGESPLLARFEGAYAATILTVMGDRTGFVWQAPPADQAIDRLIADKLKRTKTLPSALCTDDEFLRRIYLDLTGLPPSAKQVRQFLADTRPQQTKRDEIIDRLIGNPDFVEYWTSRWCDLLQVNRKFLGQPGAAAFRDWIREALASNMPYDQFVYALLTASGSSRENPAVSYYKILRTPEEALENTTHLFLATRFNCNKCHDHPFERWTQDQYYELAAYFAQVGLKPDPASGEEKVAGSAAFGDTPLYEIAFDAPTGEIRHPRTGQTTLPAVPYQAAMAESVGPSRRETLARWLTAKENRYFAKSYANRLWGYLLGTGLIEPIDDIRAGNPPSNPELLDYLTDVLVKSNFDVRTLIRTICRSNAYQRSIETNSWNSDDQINYSHAIARRLPAEVLYDAIYFVTGSTPSLPGHPAGLRAVQILDVGKDSPAPFLEQLGRPARESACECQRESSLRLAPIMALINGATTSDAIADPQNAIAKLVASQPDDAKLVDELFLRILNRPATTEEISLGIEAIRAPAKEANQQSQLFRPPAPASAPKVADEEWPRHQRQLMTPHVPELFALLAGNERIFAFEPSHEAELNRFSLGTFSLDQLDRDGLHSIDGPAPATATPEDRIKPKTPQPDPFRFIGAQDLAWALINSPAFLFNR